MVFDSLAFFAFLVPVLGISWALRGRARQLFLLAASWLFYGYWDWRFLGLIWLSTLVDYVAALGVERARDRGRSAKPWMTASLVLNLGMLGVFKYLGFFAESLQEALSPFGVTPSWPTLNIVLPVGISFYTFQTLAYTIDVYRGRVRAERDPIALALYVAWFPQLVAGPIERADRLLPQLKAPPRLDAKGISDGLTLLLWGMFKKVVIADRMALVVNAAFASGDEAKPAGDALEVYVALLAFALQIYADFSGYSDIARGVSRLFGVELMLNFKHPYLATGPQDFWRRWHVSLSEWLRDYLYISLGGSRGGERKTYRNLFLTMLLGGLWHGAAWNFVLWGAYHGALLCLERAVGLAGKRLFGIRHALAVVVFLQLTLFGWLLFRVGSMAQLGDVLAHLTTLGADHERALSWGWQVGLAALPIALMHVEQIRSRRMDPLATRGNLAHFLFAWLALVGILLLHVPSRIDFIYFQF